MTHTTNQKIFADSYISPQISIGELFADFNYTKDSTVKQKYFRIPFYQRGYAWGIRQCYDLWEDIERVKKNLVLKPDTLHHLGIFTLKKNLDFDNDPRLYNHLVFDVADGQQRLITLTLIIRLLIKRISDSNSDISVFLGASEFTRKLQYSTSAPDPRNFFEKCVYMFNIDAATENSIYHENIESAMAFFWKDDISYDNNYETISPNIKQWDRTKKQHRKSVGIELMNPQEAMEYLEIIKNNFIVSINFINFAFDENIAFETMNNRGKKLTDLEVLKNRLIYLATGHNKDTIRKKINDVWVRIYKNLGITIKNISIFLNDDMFLRAHWYMYHGNINRERGDMHRSQIFDKVFAMDNDSPPIELENSIIAYVKSLEDSCILWGFLNMPEAKIVWDINKSLMEGDVYKYVIKLSHIAGVNSYAYVKSLILALLLKKSQDPELPNALKTIENYLFIIGYMGDKVDYNNAFNSTVLGTYANEVFQNDKPLSEIIKALTEKIINALNTKNEKNIIEKFTAIKNNKNGYYAWSGRFYLLYEYNQYLGEKRRTATQPLQELTWYTFRTIEHILPETPSNPYWTVVLNGLEKHKNEIIHSLGNLLPLDSANNSSLGNENYYIKCNGKAGTTSFKYKLGNYSTLNLVEVYGDRYWSVQQINHRLSEICKYIYNAYIANYDICKEHSAQTIYAELKVAKITEDVRPKNALIKQIECLLLSSKDVVLCELQNSLRESFKYTYSSWTDPDTKQKNPYIQIYREDWYIRYHLNVHYELLLNEKKFVLHVNETFSSAYREQIIDMLNNPNLAELIVCNNSHKPLSKISGNHCDGGIDLSGAKDINKLVKLIVAKINATYHLIDAALK